MDDDQKDYLDAFLQVLTYGLGGKHTPGVGEALTMIADCFSGITLNTDSSEIYHGLEMVSGSIDKLADSVKLIANIMDGK